MTKRLSVGDRRRRRLVELRGKIDWAETELFNLPSRIQRYRDEVDELTLAEKNDKKAIEEQSQTKFKGGDQDG